MNFPSNEILLERQRGRQWNPLITQQLRLRHINQVVAFNLFKNSKLKSGTFYFTLHLTTMSAPFYTSEKVHGPNPKWTDLNFNKFPSISGFVLRIWQQTGTNSDLDAIVITWGLHLSGLVYLGNRTADVQPSIFKLNAVIFYMFGGYLTISNTIKDDVSRVPSSLLEHLNVEKYPSDMRIRKYVHLLYSKSEIKRSYNVQNLQKLHYKEVQIKNKFLDVQLVQEKIVLGSNYADILPESNNFPNPKNTPQLLTMNSLNKMLQEKPTKIQKREMYKIDKEMEIARFRNKLLSQERDMKVANVKRLRKVHTLMVEENEEKESYLMEKYHILSREKEKLKEFQKTVLQHRELLIHMNSQLQHRKKQLLNQLLFIFPIEECADKKFTIRGVYLPNSDLLSDCSDIGISVALGYITHILTMCSTFLQVPLRYSLVHYGSRSHVMDQISPMLPDREREFPLYTKGKDRMQFTYGVYLLNKNIAQLRWLFFMNTLDLKSTLPNLLNFLQGYKEYKQEPFMMLKNTPDAKRSLMGENSFPEDLFKTSSTSNVVVNSQNILNFNCFGSNPNISDPILDCLRHAKQIERSVSPTFNSQKKPKNKISISNNEYGPGLSEILAIPEAFLNKQISSDSFQSYTNLAKYRNEASSGDNILATSALTLDDETTKNSTFNFKKESNCDMNVKIECRQPHEVTINESIEEGTDLLDPTLNLNEMGFRRVDKEANENSNDSADIETKQIERKSTSASSYVGNDSSSNLRSNMELRSDSLLNISNDSDKSMDSISDGHQDFMQKWLSTGPALICSDESLYPHEYLGASTSAYQDSPLTARTNALLTTKSFNLVRPKH